MRRGGAAAAVSGGGRRCGGFGGGEGSGEGVVGVAAVAQHVVDLATIHYGK